MTKDNASKKTPPVKKNDRVKLIITALGSEGQGVGRIDGYTVFVPSALPGETVTAHILKAGASCGFGKLIDIEEPSSTRREPFCFRSGKCGGCALMHMDYPSQLEYKRGLVRDALNRLGGIRDIEVLPTLGMDEPYYYRNKASFPFGFIDGRAEVGFYAPRTHRVVPTNDCALLHESVMLAALAVRDWANEHNISVYDEQTKKGFLRHVIAREGSTGELMVTVTATGGLPKMQALVDTLTERLPGLNSLYLNINTADTNVILGEQYRLLYGEPTIKEELLGINFTIGPASFLQVNHIQTEKMYKYALDMLELTGRECIVDAYCGIGTISLLMARAAKEVIGIENVPHAVEDAKRNAKDSGFNNAQFICGEAEEILPKLIKDGIDVLVLDPPRKGAEEEFIQAAIESRVEKIAYISCNQATLARDCAMLVNGGYKVEIVQPVDMFPQTVHVETIVLLKYQDI